MSRALRSDLRLGFAAASLKPRRSRARLPAFSITTAMSAPVLGGDTISKGFSTLREYSQQVYTTVSNSTSNIAAPTETRPAPQNSLAIIFTDIVESTQLWEASPEAMKEAMDLHDNLIRELTDHHHGYEVKQNGDGFMIAFQTAIAALEFCLDVQKKLMEIEWPAALLELQPGSEVKRNQDAEGGSDAGEEVLWRGLRLRMSAHFGDPVCKWNEVIERMDYLGPMVNRAARFIGVTEAGQIVVSEEFLDELQKAKNGGNGNSSDPGGERPLISAAMEKHNVDAAKLDLTDLPTQHAEEVLTESQFEVRLLGEREFKGLEDMQKLYFIIPYSLRGRVQHWPQHKHVPGSKGNLVG